MFLAASAFGKIAAYSYFCIIAVNEVVVFATAAKTTAGLMDYNEIAFTADTGLAFSGITYQDESRDE